MTTVDPEDICIGDVLVLAYPDQGYPYDQEKAWKIVESYGPNPEFTVKAVDIGSWHTTITFNEINGHWNSVHFSFKDK